VPNAEPSPKFQENDATPLLDVDADPSKLNVVTLAVPLVGETVNDATGNVEPPLPTTTGNCDVPVAPVESVAVAVTMHTQVELKM